MNPNFIEELSLNHWPPLSTLLYDGWVLRFADGYTKRANSISPIYESVLDLEHKIEVCEQIYSANKLPTIFKITPFIPPSRLDHLLEDKGYSLIDPTSVLTLPLADIPEPLLTSATIAEDPGTQWLEDYSRIADLTDRNKNTLKAMLSNIRTKKGFTSYTHEDRVVSCGLGVIEREYIGLYDIVTDAHVRNRGFAEQMILNLLKWGKENGATSSYLAVVANNAAAQRLYSKLGYSEVYKYWYRVKAQKENS